MDSLAGLDSETKESFAIIATIIVGLLILTFPFVYYRWSSHTLQVECMKSGYSWYNDGCSSVCGKAQ